MKNSLQIIITNLSLRKKVDWTISVHHIISSDAGLAALNFFKIFQGKFRNNFGPKD